MSPYQSFILFFDQLVAASRLTEDNKKEAFLIILWVDEPHDDNDADKPKITNLVP